MDRTLTQLVRAAEAGGQVLRRYFGKSLATTRKSTTADFFTAADLAAESAVLAILKRAFPAYNIMSEEHGHIDRRSAHTLVVDPLDGTNNFVLGIPNFSTSIALFHGTKVTHAAIYQPILRETFYAERGRGAYCNGRRLRVNNEHRVGHGTVAYSCPYSTSAVRELKFWRAFLGLGVKRVLSTWSPSVDFCLLAQGKLEAVVSDRNELYDFAAGKLMALEAGVRCTDFSGRKISDDHVPTFVASNGPAIHRALITALRGLR